MFKKRGDGYWEKLLRVLLHNFYNFQVIFKSAIFKVLALWKCGVKEDRMSERVIILTALF